jgi:calcium-translocating P-type ATPase
MLYYTKTIRQTLEELDVSENGLAVTEASERLRIHGYNSISIHGEPFWRKLIEPFANVFMLVLFVAVIISLFQHSYIDAGIIGLIMTVSTAIYYVQRFSTERILRSLQRHHAQSIEVLRDNKVVTIDSSQLVPGDIIMLGEGEKVPADARLVSLNGLRMDESQLTGESMAVDKSLEPLPGNKEVYERTNMLFQGSFVIAGEATAVVVTTGNNTEFGQLAALTKDADDESPVQHKIDILLSQIIAAVAAMAVVAFLLSTYRGIPVEESLRFVIALSVSAVPESLPVAISVILVLAMRRMATKKALVRTMRAIETIGAITTIATDKTGTLTKNKLTVQASWQPAHVSHHLPEIIARAINYRSQKMHDPLDTALHEYVMEKKGSVRTHAPLTVFPFDQTTAMSGNLWHHGAIYDLTVKGAPEHVLARSDLTDSEHELANTQLHKMTSQGYRVIAIARVSLPREIHSFNELTRGEKLTFVGFVAVADILRPEAKRSIQAALNAGVSVRMITGDHFETAYHIGRQLGMVTHRDQVFDTRRLHVMSDEELEEIIETVKVFSRVIPEHKYRILALLKKHHITAMTGDGVNDVPALANAHVGVAMGSGAQIAKDAGDIILLDDNFKSIVTAMGEGRTVLANIRRMLFYLLATNTGEVLTMLGSLALNMPIPLVPVQILWVNLVTDTAMVIPLGLEPGEKTMMSRPPKHPDAPILSKFMVSRMVLLALTMAILTLSMYAYFSHQYGHEYGRTIAFCSLVVMQWASAFCARSDYESTISRLRVFNGKFYAGLAVALTLQALAIFGPLSPLLHVAPVAIGDLVITGTMAFFVPIIVMEIHKFIGRRFYHKGA